MSTITLDEFYQNFDKYLQQADVEKVRIRKNGKIYELRLRRRWWRRRMDNDTYFANPAVRAHLEEAMQEEREGKLTRISSEDFRKMAGL